MALATPSLTFELVSKGLNLVLVGRNPQIPTSNEIWDKSGEKTQIEIKTIVVDLEKASGEEIKGQVRREIEGLDLGAPFFVATRMMSNIIDWEWFLVCSPEKYCKASLRWIGYDSLCVPNATHTTQACVLSLLSKRVPTQLVFDIKLGLRNRLLRHEKSTKST
ncbi:hypothetical protein Cgig2_018201 [Carnegiea gigantea]|uniref:Uncharacterized protein n=1 Tax=Carnegiea gigantea TaxID=171969 RepID=A0A9Q1KXP3_9CARY|nr:hypothetical protein Cgig2_018201 [Carnegiea gigantea]